MVTFNHYPLNVNVDDGGPWQMQKTFDVCSPANLIAPKFEGDFTVGNPRYGWASLSTTAQPTDLAMKGLGTTAIARCAPSNPSFSIPQFIGELREGLPSIVGHGVLKERTRKCREAGSEYLNVEFGWKPLVSDLRKFATAVNDSHEIWENYRKGSNQKTRVGYHYPEEADSVSVTGEFIPVPTTTYYGFLTGTAVQYRVRKNWFKGCFKYYIPEPVDFHTKMQYWQSEASKLLGVRLTPDTVWNLNPWTWAADWFANTGDLMTNVSNLGTDGLVLQYGYQMAEETLRTHRVGGMYNSFTGNYLSSTRDTLQKRCKRVPSSPYGFNATLATLTGRQLAIIAALGLSST
jgi:hypothetical protein